MLLFPVVPSCSHAELPGEGGGDGDDVCVTVQEGNAFRDCVLTVCDHWFGCRLLDKWGLPEESTTAAWVRLLPT